MRAISLFSGAGGMDFGFKKAGFKIIIANEMDQNASKTFSENHHEVKMLTGDIRSHSEEIFAQKKYRYSIWRATLPRFLSGRKDGC